MAKKKTNSKKRGKKPELFSVHPLTFEQAIRRALKADPEKVRAKIAGKKTKA